MGKIHILRADQDTEYWRLDREFNNYKKKRLPFHLYVEDADEPFITDKMICNYKDAGIRKYLWNHDTLGTRLREHKDFIVIEPSGIMIPKTNFKITRSKEDRKINPGIDISEITRTSYLCDLISDSTRGGRDVIFVDEIEEYRNKLLSQSNSSINTSFLTPLEFAYMFIKLCNKNRVNSFKSSDLLDIVIKESNGSPEYLPLLWNIEYSVGEHEDKSESLFKAFALLRYIGLIHPDYDSDAKYNDLVIANNVVFYPDIIKGKNEYMPLMEKFVADHIGSHDGEEKYLIK